MDATDGHESASRSPLSVSDEARIPLRVWPEAMKDRSHAAASLLLTRWRIAGDGRSHDEGVPRRLVRGHQPASAPQRDGGHDEGAGDNPVADARARRRCGWWSSSLTSVTARGRRTPRRLSCSRRRSRRGPTGRGCSPPGAGRGRSGGSARRRRRRTAGRCARLL